MTGESTIEVRGQFQCTFEDYHEAATFVPPPVSPGRRRSTSWSAWGWILAIVFGLILFGVLTKQPPPPGGPPATAPPAKADAAAFIRARAAAFAPLGRFAIAMLPMILISISGILFSIGSVRRPVVKPWSRGLPPKSSKLTHLAGFVMITAMMIAILGLALWRSSPNDSAAGLKPSTSEWTLGVAPMALAIGTLVILTKLQRKAQLRAQWNAQPALHRVHQIEANQVGVNVIESLSRHNYSWESLCGYRETTGLLLLYTSAYAHWMIPKRAFADPLDLDRFKGLIMTYVDSGYFLDTPAGAFGVKSILTEAEDVPFAQVSAAPPASVSNDSPR